MNADNRKSLESYYGRSRSWAEDRQQALHVSRKAAWIVAGVASGVALLEAAALIALTPLKTVVPYTLLVDRTTGFVQALDPVGARRISADSALMNALIVQYVIARESFDVGQAQSNYHKVGLWSAEAARAQYLSAMQPSNPVSPFGRYPRGTVVETAVKSVSPIAPDVVLVRFETVRRDADGAVASPQAWVAVVRYRLSGAPMSAGDRFINPLGFQVVQYRRDPEALTPNPPPPSKAASNFVGSSPPSALAASPETDAAQSSANRDAER